MKPSERQRLQREKAEHNRERVAFQEMARDWVPYSRRLHMPQKATDQQELPSPIYMSRVMPHFPDWGY